MRRQEKLQVFLFVHTSLGLVGFVHVDPGCHCTGFRGAVRERWGLCHQHHSFCVHLSCHDIRLCLTCVPFDAAVQEHHHQLILQVVIRNHRKQSFR